MATFLLRLQGLSNAAQEQTRLPVGCEERVHPAATSACELELELIQPHMTQEPMLRGEVGACRFTQLTSTTKR